MHAGAYSLSLFEAGVTTGAALAELLEQRRACLPVVAGSAGLVCR